MAARRSLRLVSQLEEGPKSRPPPPPPPESPHTRSRKKQRISVLDPHQSEYDYLTKLPPDILLEVFRRLEPIDILHLSRTSKKLHSLLSSGKFTSVWKVAYDNIPATDRPPLCPDDVNISHYTNFLFGRHCQFCAASDQKQLHHNTALVRICYKCAETCLVDKDSVNKEAGNLCHTWKTSWRHSHHILKFDYNQRYQELQAKQGKERAEYCNIRQTIISDRFRHAEVLKKWQDDKDGATLARVREIIHIPKSLFPVGKSRQADKSKKHGNRN